MRTAAVLLKVGLVFKSPLTFTTSVLVVTGMCAHVSLQPGLGAVLLATLCARERLLVDRVSLGCARQGSTVLCTSLYSAGTGTDVVV